jgi:hypothetical protein
MEGGREGRRERSVEARSHQAQTHTHYSSTTPAFMTRTTRTRTPITASPSRFWTCCMTRTTGSFWERSMWLEEGEDEDEEEVESKKCKRKKEEGMGVLVLLLGRRDEGRRKERRWRCPRCWLTQSESGSSSRSTWAKNNRTGVYEDRGGNESSLWSLGWRAMGGRPMVHFICRRLLARPLSIPESPLCQKSRNLMAKTAGTRKRVYRCKC